MQQTHGAEDNYEYYSHLCDETLYRLV